jgi:hypothetical protein
MYYTYDSLYDKSKIPDNAIEFYCRYTNLTLIPELPQSLAKLYCCDNKLLTTLPVLPYKLEGLWCCDNNLIELPELPEKLTFLQCESNNLVELPELPVKLKELYCSHNNIKYLSPSNCQIIKSIEFNVDILYNPVSDGFNSNGQFQDSL